MSPRAPVLDLYPYASTNPIYLQLPEPPPAAPDDAACFVAWLDRVLGEAAARDDCNTEREKRLKLDYLRAAQACFRQLADSRTARSP